MEEIWFTSDLHFGHERIIELCNRPYADVDEMNMALVQNWNETVSTDDTVFVLGDVAMGRLAETLPLCVGLNGTKLLVPGNHDRCWGGHRKVRPQDIEAYQKVGFKILDGQVKFGDWLLCHFPTTGDSHGPDRYAAHRPKFGNRTKAIIHGHVHSAWKVMGREINVGVDVWGYRPVNYWQVEALVRVAQR